MRGVSIGFAIAAVCWTSPGFAQGVGSFSGNPVVELSGNGHTATLRRPFSFRDASGKLWAVPTGTVLDGASIPQPFWTFIGGPWNGAYRDASIIHDYYCEKKDRPWKEVHRVFYEGMLARNVDSLKAKIMYYAVYKFGPRWETVTTKVPGGVGFDGQPKMLEETVTVTLPSDAYDATEFEADQKAITSGNLSLEQIEALVDT